MAIKHYGDDSATRHYPVTPGATVLSPRPRALYCQTSGTVTVEDDLAQSVVYTVSAGQILLFSAYKVTAATATVVAWL